LSTNLFIKGEYAMKMPKTLSVWFISLYFLLAGLGYFGLNLPLGSYIMGVLAILAAIFYFIGK